MPENEEHYRDLVENSRDLISTHDLNGVLLTVNLAAARSLGYEPGELVNRNVRDFLSPKSHEEFDAFLAAIREKGAAAGFMRLRTKSGETRIWSYTSTVRTEGVQVPFVRGVAHDVTDLLHAQKALRKSEERLRVAAEVGRMYAWEWDPATDSVLRSAECAGILDLDAATGDGTAKDYFILVHPDDRARLWGLATSLTPRNPEYRTEYRRFRPDGTLLWLQESGHATFDKAGKMVRLVGMTADITERKHAEEARFKHAAIVESSDDAIISKDLDGIIQSWNLGAQRIFGFTETEVVGASITMLIPPELRDEEITVLKRLRAGERIEHYETLRVAKGGKKINVSLTLSPIKDSSGRIAGISKIARDITERKRAEQKLRESEEKFRSVFRDAGIGMVIVSPEGRFLAGNEAFCEFLGYTEQELVHKTVQSVTHPEDWPTFSKRLNQALADGGCFQQVEKRCLHKNGQILCGESSASLIRDSEGKPLYFVAEVLDITERKRASAVPAGERRTL